MSETKDYRRLHFCFIRIISLLLVLISNVSTAQSVKNVIIILIDDMGYYDLGVNGNPYIKTPFLDSLYRHSFTSEHFYTYPSCSPSRAALMTGHYASYYGVIGVQRGREILVSEAITLAEVLKKNGLSTVHIGKWHLGDNYPYRAMDQGFEESLTFLGGGLDKNNYYNPQLLNNGEFVRREGYCSDVFTSEAINYIGNNKDQPFFMYLAYNAPHTPLVPPKEYLKLYDTLNLGDEVENKTQIKALYAMITNLDDNIKRLYQKLITENIMDETLVIITSDNGIQEARYNGEISGLKGSVFDGGIKNFLIMNHPAVNNKEIPDQQANAIYDIAPTVMETMGLKSNEMNGAGVNIFNSSQNNDRKLYIDAGLSMPNNENHSACVIKYPYKLIKTIYDNPINQNENIFLVNIEDDIKETTDIKTKEPVIFNGYLSFYEKAYKENWHSSFYHVKSNILNSESKKSPIYLVGLDPFGHYPLFFKETDTKFVRYWKLDVQEAAYYNIRIKFADNVGKWANNAVVGMIFSNFFYIQKRLEEGQVEIEFENCYLPAIDDKLEIFLYDKEREKVLNPELVSIRFVGK